MAWQRSVCLTFGTPLRNETDFRLSTLPLIMETPTGILHIGLWMYAMHRSTPFTVNEALRIVSSILNVIR